MKLDMDKRQSLQEFGVQKGFALSIKMKIII